MGAMDTLDDLIRRCGDCAVDGPQHVRDAVGGADLAATLAAIRGRPKPWFFHAATDLTVFATESRPGSGSAPHDHGMWAVIACLAGREGSRRYRDRDGALTETGIAVLDTGQVHAVPADGIHAVFNCWEEPNVVLHVYGGDFLASPKRVWDPVTGDRWPLGLVEPLAPVGATT